MAFDLRALQLGTAAFGKHMASRAEQERQARQAAIKDYQRWILRQQERDAERVYEEDIFKKHLTEKRVYEEGLAGKTALAEAGEQRQKGYGESAEDLSSLIEDVLGDEDIGAPSEVVKLLTSLGQVRQQAIKEERPFGVSELLGVTAGGKAEIPDLLEIRQQVANLRKQAKEAKDKQTELAEAGKEASREAKDKQTKRISYLERKVTNLRREVQKIDAALADPQTVEILSDEQKAAFEKTRKELTDLEDELDVSFGLKAPNLLRKPPLDISRYWNFPSTGKTNKGKVQKKVPGF